MPITQVTYQPQIDSLNAAFRPIVFKCKAKIPNSTPENYIPTVVYCDIYLNNVYYKSISRSAFINDDGIAPEYEFDIQDAVQEVMTSSLPIMDGSLIEDHTDNLKTVFVKFRNSYLDVNGFNVSEQTAPIQGTSSSAPVSGAGTQSNTFYVLYAVLQLEDNQNLKDLLSSYKTGVWSTDSYPLTRRPENIFSCSNDSSHFPIITLKTPKLLVFSFRTAFAEADLSVEINNTFPPGMKILYVPEGLQNIKTYFPMVNFSEILSWKIYLKDESGNVFATTRINTTGCCCGDEKTRIHFINSCGNIDSINFILNTEESETKSATWQKSQQFPLDRTKGGNYRINIESNENYEVETKCYGEKDQYWIKELANTPLAWIETFLPNGFNAPVQKEFIPITILDSKLPTKDAEAFEYVVKIKFSMANSNSNLR